MTLSQAGYQITQQRRPLAVGGHVEYPLHRHTDKTVRSKLQTARLIQLQLEQDSGKSLHDDEMSVSLIDLNRAGLTLLHDPLIDLVQVTCIYNKLRVFIVHTNDY